MLLIFIERYLSIIIKSAIEFNKLRGKFNNESADSNYLIGMIYENHLNDRAKAKYHYGYSVYLYTKI